MEEEQQQQQPQIRTTPYANPMTMYGSAIITMTNPDSELHKMELMFRSARVDKDGNPISCGSPLMNEYGINAVLGTIQSIVNQVTVMSNLDKNEIPMMMDFLGDTLAKDLMVNRLNYGIISSSARDKIYFSALSSSFITMKRAFEEGDKRFWKGSVQEIHSKIDTNPQKRGGVLSRLNPWNKN